jgi:hypothetical protein
VTPEIPEILAYKFSVQIEILRPLFGHTKEDLEDENSRVLPNASARLRLQE